MHSRHSFVTILTRTAQVEASVTFRSSMQLKVIDTPAGVPWNGCSASTGRQIDLAAWYSTSTTRYLDILTVVRNRITAMIVSGIPHSSFYTVSEELSPYSSHLLDHDYHSLYLHGPVRKRWKRIQPGHYSRNNLTATVYFHQRRCCIFLPVCHFSNLVNSILKTMLQHLL